jgi:hypothetical protein
MTKFDDASWHWGADDFPDDAPEENGATHIGMFLTWMIERGRFADPEVPADAVEAVRTRSMSGRDFLLKCCDGKLFSGLFTAQAADFSERHYEGFIEDFQRLLCQNLPSNYYVEDTRENYEIMAAALDQRWARYAADKPGSA